MNWNCRSLTLFVPVAIVWLAVIGQIDAVNNCYYCDPEEADCHNSGNYRIVKCGSLANTAPCFKIKSTGARGCGTYPACSTTFPIRSVDYDQKRPWLWILHNLFPVQKDCFSPNEGCNELMCCRDYDRCNSATSLKMSGFVGLLFASFYAVKQLLF